MSALPKPMDESQLQDAVVKLAHLLRWRVAHFRPARTAQGWRTPVAADGAGFPDLCMVRDERLLFAELKADDGRLSEVQAAWIAALDVAGASVYIWRPRDWLDGTIEEHLR